MVHTLHTPSTGKYYMEKAYKITFIELCILSLHTQRQVVRNKLIVFTSTIKPTTFVRMSFKKLHGCFIHKYHQPT